MMLDPIVAAARNRLAALPPLAELRKGAAAAPPARNFRAAMAAPGLQVIAEIKRRSPSAGPIATDLDPAMKATEYATGGAAAISVLTEPDFFAGSLDDLRSVRAAVDVPVLRKDFVVDERQIWEARTVGADAVLLIVAVVGRQLSGLLAAAGAAELAALVEVHTEAEAVRAIDAGADIIGVNNRDLTSFVTDLAVAERIAPMLPASAVRIAESGVSDAAGAQRMAAAGYQAILVGEALVRSSDPAGLVSELRNAS